MITKTFALLVLAIFYSTIIFAQENKGIKFENGLSWAQLKEKAKVQKKYIFVDCFATWCVPCKKMDKEVYTNDTVGDYMNDKFLSIKIQMDTSKADDESVKTWYKDASMLMKEYKVRTFPSYLFFSPSGEIIHRDLGYKNPKDFIKAVSESMDNKTQFYSILKKYNSGIELTSSEVNLFIEKAKSFGDNDLAYDVANSYINKLSYDSLFAINNIWLMYEFTKKSSDRGFTIFRNYPEKIHQIVKEIDSNVLIGRLQIVIYDEEIKPYLSCKDIDSKVQSSLRKYGSLGDKTYHFYRPTIIFKSIIEPSLELNPQWDKALVLIKEQNFTSREASAVGQIINYYNNKIKNGNISYWDNFIVASEYYYENYSTVVNAYSLNGAAWNMFLKCNDPKGLKLAIKWSKKALDLIDPKDFNKATMTDTYANLLYKIRKRDEAMKWEQKAIDLTTFEVHKKTFTETLDKMRRGEKTWK